jgi:maleylacetate reductase
MADTPLLRFTYDVLPTRVIFGVGSLERISAEVERLGARRALLLSTSGRREDAERVATLLQERIAGIFDGATMHVPLAVAEAARAEARRLGADCCVAVGGGSTIGLAKAIALITDLPIVAIPTTYSGSEMTPVWGLTEGGIKRTGRDPRVLPRSVIYDPELTTGLPPAISGPSGVNAMAHAVEALYAPDTNPIVMLMAEEAIRALAVGLPGVVREPHDLPARSEALYGAWLAGSTLGTVSMGLHHKLCHTLGGRYNLPHAEVHTILLPHVMRYNQAAAPEAMRRIARALGVDDAAEGMWELAARLGARMALREIGMRAEDLDEAAALATRDPYGNPAPVTEGGIRRLLENAFDGRRPGSA